MSFSRYRSKPLSWWLRVPLYITRKIEYRFRHTPLMRMFLRRRLKDAVWIDVGANHGQITLPFAMAYPDLTVYAFEPTPELATELRAKAPANYHVIEAAVSLCDGEATFYLNSEDMTSSLLELNTETAWTGSDIQTIATPTVKTVRLDTFLEEVNIERVDWLKIDAQGTDLDVIRSLGDYAQSIGWITAEVNASDVTQYTGADTESEMLQHMKTSRFTLAERHLESCDQSANITFRGPNPSRKIVYTAFV